MLLCDSHCHLDFEDFGLELDQVIERAQAAGVQRLISIGSGRSSESARAAVALAERYPFVWATVGIHPHDVAQMSAADWDEISLLCRRPRVRGVGETGLDYHYDHSPRPLQQQTFARFVSLAQSEKRALVVHVRDAHEDCLEILRAAGPVQGVIHCFTGGPEEARKYLELGFYLSFSGIVTFGKAEPIREAAKLVPPDRILVETDAPYLAPVPKRGRRNEPSFLVHTLGRLAEVRGEAPEALAQATWRNASALFQLDLQDKSD